MSYRLRSIKTGEFTGDAFHTRRAAEEFVKGLMHKGIATAMYLQIVAVFA